MPRTLRQRITAELGARLVLKYFPGSPPEAGDNDVMEELTAEALHEVGSTIPFPVTEVIPLDSSLTADLGTYGRLGARRLLLTEIHTLDYKPLNQSNIQQLEDSSFNFSDGWYVQGQRLFLRGQFTLSQLIITFNAIPTEIEIANTPDILRAATLFGAANGLERISTMATRAQTIVSEGVPDIRADAFKALRQVNTLRERARSLLGQYMVML